MTCWWTTCGNASPRWTTAAWNSWPAGWACSGRTWKPTIPASTACTCSAEVADGWKQRLRTKPKTITTADGSKTVIDAERICYREFLTPVRAFYLDLAQWAVEDPARWGPGSRPAPSARPRPSRARPSGTASHGWTPGPANGSPSCRSWSAPPPGSTPTPRALLQAARSARPGDAITAAGQTLTRSATSSAAASVWADDPATGKRRNLTAEEDHAFWAWATIEVLRATGIRVEELVQLSHHSLVQYRLPATGELVPLLQIAPSKTDAERLLVVSPELADVLSAIITRIRGTGHGRAPGRRLRRPRTRLAAARPGAVPAAHRRREPRDPRRHHPQAARRALARTGLTDPASGAPLHYTPHDFRRMFLTDAIMNGLPPHIAQVIAGHRDINVTLGYKAVYPDEAIQAHLAFLARRRALRPTEEYRTPTDDEWAEFLGHFERRKVATGTCGRAFGTPCIHEHSCLRCAMHWPDPAQRHPHRRDPRQPDRPHRRSRTRRLARRSRRPQNQPRRRRRQARPDRPPDPPRRQSTSACPHPPRKPDHQPQVRFGQLSPICQVQRMPM